MPNREDRNFDRPIPLIGGGQLVPEIAPALPVLIPLNAVRRVISSVPGSEPWFLLQLTDGELTIATPKRVDDGRVMWQLVEPDFWPELDVDDGVPLQAEMVECPICTAQMEVRFPCTSSLDRLFTVCPDCGYRIEDLRAHLVYDGDDDDVIG